jgi:alpha-1,2-mannosidase, putative
VLAPNGQNFWTPQTRDTEKKCIAPYYYTDSLLQGFRNSHWIVGGCTQDYGSFTLAALGGKLRLRPEERATPFSHAEEISHPHYYAVRLPQEHLKVEMTGSSHTAIFRITPEQDGPVHILLNHNSDEGEGYLEIDNQAKTIYGCNPVHRIYQGWGEPAGFSGHFVLQAYDEIVDSGCDSLCAWFTFSGKANMPIILKAASSFTTKRGAEDNFAFEAEGHDFESMMEQLAQQWMDRLHTIDVEDPDTARVNQFYGALYRCSFLPREMSDVDGTYPSFSNGMLADGKRKYYGDYSMWDTYRAVHPLYNIIAPQQSADMMQSLVTMYEQGGWLPIFPCWNSYTAAMIGDHCSVVLADAYVKGIRDFNVEKAYEGMRKNAFETPASFEDYKNGMGRRALPSYLKYGYIPLEDGVKDAFHQDEQTSRTLEYAFDDFAVAQMAKALGKDADYQELMRRSENWCNVINPKTGYCDGRHEPKQISRKKTDGGKFEDNLDFIHRKSYITEGATCHYTWYVPQNVEGLVEMLGGKEKFEAKLDSMFTEGRYWHGNEPCHQIAYLYDFINKPEKTQQRVAHILDTEYNDTPGGLSGNDDAGQMSAWYVFSSMGFYPVCPATDRYMLSAPRFQKVTLNLQNGKKFIITPISLPKDRHYITHGEIVQGN